jgi:hypothetical protein
VSAREQLEIERGVAIASELHPDHWPAWLRELGERLDAGQAWVERVVDGKPHQEASGLALALVDRDPVERIGYRGPELSPRTRIRFVAQVQRVSPLREAILVARAPDIEQLFGRCAADCQGNDPAEVEQP